MASAAKDKGADVLDHGKTEHGGTGRKDGGRHGQKPSGPAEGGGDPSHDSPKRHGDKMEHARDAAAGRGKAK